MANDISAVSDILIAEAHMVLREMATTARRVTSEYQPLAAEKNQRIDIPIASPKSVTAITNPATPPASNEDEDFAPTTVQVTLDQWKMTSFSLTDKEQMELKPGIFPSEAEEALRALVNDVDTAILATALETFAQHNTTTASALGWDDMADLDRVMFDNLCPLSDRSLFVNGRAKSEFLKLQEFIHYDKTGETEGLRQGSLGTRLGIETFANQNVGTHTTGSANDAYVISGTPAKGTTALTLTTGTGTFNVGDIINIAGSGDHAVTVGGTTTITVRPGLRAAMSGGEAVTYPGGIDANSVYDNNYCFHRRAIAFGSRPLAQVQTPGTEVRMTADPLSGLSVRLEVRRVGKNGVKLIRPELVARLARITTT
jgi:hypothetical protein